MTESKNLVNVIKNIKKGATYGLNIDGFSTLTDSNLSGLLETITKKEELEAFPDFVSEYINEKELNILLKKEINGEKFFDLLPVDFKINLIKKEKKFIKKIPKESIEILFSKMKNKDYKKENSSYIIPKLDLNNSHILNKIITNGRVLFQYLTEDQIKDLSDEAISKLDKACLLSIAEKNNLKYLPNPNAIKIEIFSGLTDEVKNKFSREQLLNLDKEHFNVAIEQNFVNIPRSFEEVKEFIKDENFPEHIAEYFITKIPKKDIISQINDIPNKYMFFITEENIKNLPKESAIQLARNNKLQYLSDIQLKNLNNLDLYNKYDINKLSGNLTEDQVKTQLKRLIESDKLQYLPKEVIGTITDKIIKDSGEDFIKQLSVETLDYLSAINGDGVVIANKKICVIDLNSIDIEKFKQLKPETIKNFSSEQIGNLDKIHLMEILPKMTKEQAKNISLEQFDTIYKEDKNYITSEIIAGLDPKIICEQDEFLKNLTKEQAKSLSREQVSTIALSNKLSILSSDTLKKISKKIKLKDIQPGEIKKLHNEGKLNVLGHVFRDLDPTKLSEEELEIIRNTDFLIKNKNIESKENNEFFNTGFFDDYVLDYKNINEIFDNCIEENNWQELRERTSKIFLDGKEKNIKNINEIIDDRVKKTKKDVFGYSDKIELLKIKLLVNNNDVSKIKEIYNKITDSVENLLNSPTFSPFEDVAKIKNLLSIANDNNFNSDLREKLFKQITNMTDQFEEKNFTNKGITPSNDMLELRREIYVSYMDLLVNKYQDISIDNISSKNDSDLSLHEREFKTCIQKAEINDGILNSLKNSYDTYKMLGIGALKRWLITNFSSVGAVMGTAFKTAAVFMTKKEIDYNNELNAAISFDKNTLKKQRKKPISFYNKIRIFFSRILKPKRKIITNKQQNNIDALGYNNHIKYDNNKLLKKQFEKTKISKIDKIINNYKNNKTNIKDRAQNIHIELANLKIKAIEEEAKRKKLILNQKEVTNPVVDVKNKELEIQKIEKQKEKDINDVKCKLCKKLISSNKENLQKFDSYINAIEECKNKINNMYDYTSKDGIIPIVKEIENSGKIHLNSDIVEDLAVSIENNLNNDDVLPNLKQKNIEKVNPILEKETANGNLNIQDPKIAQNLATMLKAMDKFIATQMAISYASTVGLDAVRQKELEREKARINDMQQKLKENGTNHLAISSEQELRIY